MTSSTSATSDDENALKNLIANYSGVSVDNVKKFIVDDGSRRRTSEVFVFFYFNFILYLSLIVIIILIVN